MVLVIPHWFCIESGLLHLEDFDGISCNCKFDLLAKEAMLHSEPVCVSETCSTKDTYLLSIKTNFNIRTIKHS